MSVFRKRKLILILWYSVDKNLGDYYLLQTVCDHIREWGYDYVDMDVGLSWDLIAKQARKVDFLWFAGGGIIERGIPNIILNFEKFHIKAKRVKYGISGLSIGQFDYSFCAKSIEYWVKNATYFYARDEFTCSELNRLSCSKLVESTSDIVFAYSMDNLHLPKNSRYELGVNFRELPYADLSGEFKWNEWNLMLDNLKMRIIGIPDQHDCSKYMSVKYDQEYTPELTLQVISSCKYVLAMRFHIVLFAARMEIIPIPIEYCPKVRRLATQLGIQDLIVGVHEFNKVPSIIQKVKDNRDMYKNIVKENANLYEEKAKIMFKEIEKCLKESL